MSKNTIDPAPNPSCFAFLAACLASVIPSSFAPDWRVEASRPLANSTNPNPCASNALFFPVHVLCVSLGGAVSQYPENENVLRSTGRAASPGYSFRSNPKYTFLSAGTLTLLSSSNGELGRAARTDSSATMMVKLVAMRLIRKDYHYIWLTRFPVTWFWGPICPGCAKHRSGVRRWGEYDSAAVTWILFPFFKEAARRLVSGPP